MSMEPFDLRAWPEFSEAELSCSITGPVIIDQVAIDSRRISSRNALFVALSGAHFDGHAFIKEAYKNGARSAIVKKGVACEQIPCSMKLFKVDDPLKALQQIAASYRLQMQAKIVAITGSFGKTMLKDLLHHLVEPGFETFSSPESFNSQLGVALSLLKIRSSCQVAIIEAGISKANEMKNHLEMIKPDNVIITNIGSAHIGTMLTKEAIAKEKMQLAMMLKKENWCLLPSDIITHLNEISLPGTSCYFWDKQQSELPKIRKCKAKEKCSLSYDITFPSGFCYTGEIQDGTSYFLDLIQMGTKAAYLLGVSEESIAKSLESYYPEPMRIELWKSQHGATIINDTYCADPMSCDIALKQFETLEEKKDARSEATSEATGGRKIFLFSGLRRTSEHTVCDLQRIAHAIAKHKVNLCILSLPKEKLSNELVSQINLISPQTEVIVAKNDKDASFVAKTILGPGDAVIIKGPKKRPILDLIKDFEESLPNNQVIINLAAIQSNIELIRARLDPGIRIMVMVKALAYGTDDVRIAKFLKNAGINILGVSYVDEGVAMREQGVRGDIFVLNAMEHEISKAVKWNLELGVSDAHLISYIQKEALLQNKKIKVHLHVDTGMCRFGCRKDEVLLLGHLINNSPNLIFEGLMTHFASSENPQEDEFTLQQAKILEDAIDALANDGIQPRYKHASNSSAAIRFGFKKFNMIRIGLAAYGLHTSQATQDMLDLRPAISLVSRIVGINECKEGDTISYGRAHKVQKSTARIAVLPIGYFDGLHRNYSGKGFVMIRGERAPMVGKICMDYMMCDITDIPDANLGDPVLIFGEDENGQYLSPEELAKSGGSIVHELMTCLGPRIRRLFIYDESLRPR